MTGGSAERLFERDTLPTKFTVPITHRPDGAVVVTVIGELDLFTAPILKQTLSGIMRAPLIVLNLAQLEFIDSSGLSVFIAARKRITAYGGTFRLQAVPDKVMRILDITGLNQFFEIDGDLTDV